MNAVQLIEVGLFLNGVTIVVHREYERQNDREKQEKCRSSRG
ncbi:hypothetical protein [Metabacillus litoralis]|nr:hypothetical protein [Metabacillus litoralis]